MLVSAGARRAQAGRPDALVTADGSNVWWWELNPDRAIAKVGAATNLMTPEVWTTYVGPDVPYRPTCPAGS